MSQATLLGLCSDNVVTILQPSSTIECLQGCSAASSMTPTGGIIMYAGKDAPNGWLLCDGASYPVISYPLLWSVIQYTYGGSGGSFRVPDLRSRVPVGAGQGTGLSNYTLGGISGEETHILTIPEMPAHHHNTTFVTFFNGDPNNAPLTGNGSTVALVPTDTVGGGGPHNNIQPVLALNYIIKY